MTATEWLIEQCPRINTIASTEIIEQAKEQEKQDIVAAYAFGHNDGCRYMTNEKQEFEHGEAYFAETFKQHL